MHKPHILLLAVQRQLLRHDQRVKHTVVILAEKCAAHLRAQNKQRKPLYNCLLSLQLIIVAKFLKYFYVFPHEILKILICESFL